MRWRKFFRGASIKKDADFNMNLFDLIDTIERDKKGFSHLEVRRTCLEKDERNGRSNNTAFGKIDVGIGVLLEEVS